MSETEKELSGGLRQRSVVPSNSNPAHEDEYMEVAAGRPVSSPFHAAAMLTLVAIVIHYLLWWPAIIISTCITYWWLGGGWLVFGLLSLPFLLYLPSFLDGSQLKLGRPWHSLRLLPIWRLGHDYVGLKVIRTRVLDPAKTYVFGWHPHGIIILSRLVMYGGVFERLFPGIDVRALGASPMFYWPGAREISLWLGAVDASRHVADKVLKAGKSIIVYPGGSKEIFHTDEHSKTTVLQLRNSLGFVAMALRHGSPLVPVVIYNERGAYTRVNIPAWLKAFCLKTLRIPPVIFYGRFFTLLPRKVNLGAVFGAPIEVPHIPAADKNHPEVQKYHEIYTKALVQLWEEHKAKFGYGEDEVLEIV